MKINYALFFKDLSNKYNEKKLNELIKDLEIKKYKITEFDSTKYLILTEENPFKKLEEELKIDIGSHSYYKPRSHFYEFYKLEGSEEEKLIKLVDYIENFRKNSALILREENKIYQPSKLKK
ncbi:MAG: hypothetical protein ABGW69_03365 [Nanoarchaeota archaeon]